MKKACFCEGMLLDEDPIQRPEGSMDYIQDTHFQNSPRFSDGMPCKLDCKARVEQGHIPKAFGVKTVPPVAKCSAASKIALPVRPAKSRVDPPKRNALLVQVR